MKHPKSYYKKLETANGYVWVGYWDDLHRFQKGSYSTGFLLCSVNDSDIEDRSYLFMMERGLTRNS